MNSARDSYGTFTKPYIARLLGLLNLDYEVLQAQGNRMNIQFADGRKKQVTDLVGGFGSSLLGHNHPAIQKAAKDFLGRQQTSHAQLSLRNKAGELCRELCRLAHGETGYEYTSFLANTGSEAVEIALRHARLQWDKNLDALIKKGLMTFQQWGQNKTHYQYPREKVLEWKKMMTSLKQQGPYFIALPQAYHGKTAATHALNTGQGRIIHWSFYNNAQVPELSFLKFPFPKITSTGLVMTDKQYSAIAAVVAEPLQGEGGVNPLSPEQAQALQNLAEQHQCPLIWDEIQSGSYRTGSLFYSSQLGVSGNYYCLGKALGGGLAKLSAVLIRSDEYLPQLELAYTSTFAEDDFSSEIGLAFLAERESIQANIQETEPLLNQEFHRLQQRFPSIIREVRGKGFIWGLEFQSLYLSGSYTLQALGRNGFFNYFLMAWLLNERGIRCSAPLSCDSVLRFHPDIRCSTSDISLLSKALHRLCDILEKQDMYALLHFLLPVKWQNLRSFPRYFKQENVVYEQPEPSVPRAGFITHYITFNTIREADPSLAILPDEALQFLMERFTPFLPPIINGSRMVDTAKGPVHLTIKGLAFTSSMAAEALRQHQPDVYRSKIQAAANWLEEEGCDVIGLGQYTSILSQNGKSLITSRATLTTGNGLTVFLAAEGLLYAVQKKGMIPENEKLAIIGGQGNIGSCLRQLIEKRVAEVAVFGNPNSHKKNRPNVFYDQSALKNYKLILVTTNSPDILLTAENTHPQAVICDLSVPYNVCPELIREPGTRSIHLGGTASLPDEQGIPSKGIPLPKDRIYGCLTETLLLALSRQYASASFGKLQVEDVLKLGELSGNYGFKVKKVDKPAADQLNFSPC